MDPDANLEAQLDLAKGITETIDRGEVVSDADIDCLAELVLALDGWIRKGGFLPKYWRK